LPSFTDLKSGSQIAIASGPETLMIAMAPMPEPVANAHILSFFINNQFEQKY
jgi:hypothetical protein